MLVTYYAGSTSGDESQLSSVDRNIKAPRASLCASLSECERSCSKNSRFQEFCPGMTFRLLYALPTSPYVFLCALDGAHLAKSLTLKSRDVIVHYTRLMLMGRK